MRNETLEQKIYKAIRESESNTTDKGYFGMEKEEIITYFCIAEGVTADEVRTALKWLEDYKQIAMTINKLYKNNKCVAVIRLYNTREYLGEDFFEVNGMADKKEN